MICSFKYLNANSQWQDGDGEILSSFQYMKCMKTRGKDGKGASAGARCCKNITCSHVNQWKLWRNVTPDCEAPCLKGEWNVTLKSHKLVWVELHQIHPMFSSVSYCLVVSKMTFIFHKSYIDMGCDPKTRLTNSLNHDFSRWLLLHHQPVLLSQLSHYYPS